MDYCKEKSFPLLTHRIILQPHVWVFHTRQFSDTSWMSYNSTLTPARPSTDSMRWPAPASDASSKSKMSPVLLAINQSFHNPLLRLKHFLEQLRELEETLIFTGLFHNKGHRWIATGRDMRVRSRRVLNTGAYVHLEMGCTTLQACGYVHWPGRSSNLTLSGFFGDFIM